MLDTATTNSAYQLEVRVNSFLSNVDRDERPDDQYQRRRRDAPLMENDFANGEMVDLNRWSFSP